MNTQTIPSKLNDAAHEFTGCLWFTDHLGRDTFMSRKERQAIEATGRCSVERYMHLEDELPERNAKEKASAMDARPGAVAEGIRPIHIPQVARKPCGNPREPRPQVWHLRHPSRTNTYATCGAIAQTADVFGFSRFYHLRMDPKICPSCRVLMMAERQMEDGRKANNVSRLPEKKEGTIKPLNWTAEEHKALQQLNGSVGGRGYHRGVRGMIYDGERF